MARSSNSGTIAFGLVTIPVKFYTSASPQKVEFKLLSPAGNRVEQQYVDTATGQKVEGGLNGCDRGVEIEKGRFAHFTKDELKVFDVENDSRTINIAEFIPDSEFDPVAIEKSYYLGPDKSDKGYLLLSEAMTAKRVVAVAQWASHGKEHLVVIAPYKGIGLVLFQMYYATEVRDFGEIEIATKLSISDAERRMAQQLIDSLTIEEFDPSTYVDAYVERVRRAVEIKARGGTIKAEPAVVQPANNVLDISSLLEQSLARKPKPPRDPKGPKKPGKK